MSKRMCAAVLAGVLGMIGTSAAAVDMQEGKWESSVEMKIEGLPFPMPPISFKNTQCLTRKDLVPNMASKDQKCDVKERTVVGNTLKWKVVCTDKSGTSEGTGEITYRGSSYQGTMRTKTTDKKGQSSSSSAKLAGRRLGDCAR